MQDTPEFLFPNGTKLSGPNAYIPQLLDLENMESYVSGEFILSKVTTTNEFHGPAFRVGIFKKVTGYIFDSRFKCVLATRFLPRTVNARGRIC